MRKIAILASVWLVATVSLAYGAVAFGDDHHGGGGDDGGHCQYQHHCDD
ncbi:MAG: hypothetical protein M0Z32_07130 [Actinomycetota bacterium]|nr:hypothetical protein [Actinomycetota bacterium]MCL6092340.1 hypothetical protein [Actinomycetota bacterium]MDA8167500.1 hypothetical protein [Actinomycetota bacterium]